MRATYLAQAASRGDYAMEISSRNDCDVRDHSLRFKPRPFRYRLPKLSEQAGAVARVNELIRKLCHWVGGSICTTDEMMQVSQIMKATKLSLLA
jgi:hypothetical protein